MISNLERVLLCELRVTNQTVQTAQLYTTIHTGVTNETEGLDQIIEIGCHHVSLKIATRSESTRMPPETSIA